MSLPLLGVTWPRLKRFRVRVSPRAFVLSVAVIYSIAGVAGFFGTYDPIYTKIPNQQVTAAELAGTDWLLTHDAPPGMIKEVISRHFRLAQASLGSLRSFEMGVVQNYRTPGLTVAPHFGYDRSDSIQNVTVAGTYVIVTSNTAGCRRDASGPVWASYTETVSRHSGSSRPENMTETGTLQ